MIRWMLGFARDVAKSYLAILGTAAFCIVLLVIAFITLVAVAL